MDQIAWHEHCVLRDDVRQETLTLEVFAADLYAVRTGEAPNVYRLPDQFFDRTYPTDNLKRLVRDVLQRLAGDGGTPVIRVQVAYGGGKTHALICATSLGRGSGGVGNASHRAGVYGSSVGWTHCPRRGSPCCRLTNSTW